MKCSVTAAVAPLRKDSTDRSEMVSQALFGEWLTVLDHQEKWAFVRLENDGYEGWMDTKQFAAIRKEEHRNRITAPIVHCRHANGDSVFLPAGSMVSEDYMLQGEQPHWNGSPEAIHSCARQFLNAPYLWGGRTILGIDCSGFTQLVMSLNGFQLPRDAFQQAELGDTVSFVEEAQTGDLAFFDNDEGRIIHVGIVLREAEHHLSIIHASGRVRIDALDHQGIFNAERSGYSHKLRIIKRFR